MATARIIFQQNGDGYSTPCSRDDLVLSLPVTMLNQNNTGVVSWAWTLIDKPTGSAASIASPTASSTTFIPDIVGTYLIHLSVNGGASQDQRGAAIKTANLHYRIPAATESTEFDAYRGWAIATNAALKALDDGYLPAPPLPTFQSVYNASNLSSFIINNTNGGLQIHDAQIPTGLNLFEVDAYGAGSKFFTVTTTATTVNTNLLVSGTNQIGVNTPTPLAPVHVTTSTDTFGLVQTRAGITGGIYARNAGPTGLGIGTSSNHPLLFFTNNIAGSPSMILTTGGAVGIGTTGPSAQLDVIGTGHFSGTLSLDAGFTSGANASMGSFKITSLATPIAGTDAANKSYVDSAVSAATTTLQSAYTASVPPKILLNNTSNAIIIQDASGHLGLGLNGGRTPLFKIDSYNSASNYFTINRAGEELNVEPGATTTQATGAAVGVGYNAFWGSAVNDIYAVGVDASGSKQQIAHFNGTSWTTLVTYPGAVGDQVNTIYGFNAATIYIGVQAALGGPGGIWYTTNSGASWSQQYNTKGITTIWGPDSTHIYAGVQDNSGIVLFSNGGGGWAPVAGNVGTRFINSIWGANASEFWVATSDSIYHTTNSGSSFTSQFDTNANSTGFASIGFSVNWKSIWGTSLSNVYAVGTASGRGYIAHYDGSNWSLILNIGVPLNSIYGTHANDIYAAGSQILLYSNGFNSWIPVNLSQSILAGGVTLNAVWAPVYNQWYIATSNSNPVSIVSLGPQGGNLTTPGIASVGALVTSAIESPTNSTLNFIATVGADSISNDGFDFNTTNSVKPNRYLVQFNSIDNILFGVTGDGYMRVSNTSGFKQTSGTNIFSWTPSQIIMNEALQINGTSNTTGLATFQSHINVDGYTISLSGGASNGQALIYNGGQFVAQSVGITVAEVANTYNLLLTTTDITTVASVTPNSNGNFVCHMYYIVTIAPTDVTIEIDWSDSIGAQTLSVLPTTLRAIGSYSVASVYIQATTGADILIKFTAGTANQVYVSSTIVSV